MVITQGHKLPLRNNQATLRVNLERRKKSGKMQLDYLKLSIYLSLPTNYLITEG